MNPVEATRLGRQCWLICALVATVIGFVIVCFLPGLAEAANFPAAIKTVAMCFRSRSARWRPASSRPALRWA